MIRRRFALPAEPSSEFTIVKFSGEFVWIRDINAGALSVTNDAEAVVQKLCAEYGGRRIIYQDSMGLWDELLHDGRGRFLGFAPARNLAPEGVCP